MPRKAAVKRFEVKPEVETPLKLFCPHCGEELTASPDWQRPERHSMFGYYLPESHSLSLVTRYFPTESYMILQVRWYCDKCGRAFWRTVEYNHDLYH